jgi:hypothetical protein
MKQVKTAGDSTKTNEAKPSIAVESSACHCVQDS